MTDPPHEPALTEPGGPLNAASPPDPLHAPIPRRRIAVAAGFITVVLAAAAALIAFALTQEAPRWWVHTDPADPAVRDLARDVENGVATALTKVRAPPAVPAFPTAPSSLTIAPAGAGLPQPWKVFITTEQANAWLTARLHQWLQEKAGEGSSTFHWPPEVDQIAVNFESGLIRIGALVQRKDPAGRPLAGDRPRTIGASVRPEIRLDGSLWCTAESIQLGRLGLPASWLIGSPDAARQRVSEVSTDLAGMPQTQRVLAALKGEHPILTRAVMKLADGRRVRVLAVEPAEGRVVITCQTEQREAKALR